MQAGAWHEQAVRGRGHERFPRLSSRVVAVVMMLVVGVQLGGCAAAGGESNYRELERDPQPMQPERDPMFGANPPRLALASAAGGHAVAADVQDAVLAAAIAAQAAREAAAADTDTHSYSLEGEDRRDWEPVTYQLAAGQIMHPPTYIPSPPVSDDLTRVRRGSVESRLEAALEGADREPVTLGRVLGTPVEAGWFYIEALLMSVKLLVYPPNARELTPPSATDRATLPADTPDTPADTSSAASNEAPPIAPADDAGP